MFKKRPTEQESESEVSKKYNEEDRTRSRLPDDDRVDLACIWLAEIYTTLTIPSLRRSVRNLGWDLDRPIGSGRELEDWIQQSSETSYYTGWTSVGRISRPGEESYPDYEEVSLPPSVKCITPIFVNVAPGIICLLIRFDLTESAAGRFNGIGRTDYEPYAEPLAPSSNWALALAAKVSERAAAVHDNRQRFSKGERRYNSSWIKKRKTAELHGALVRECESWMRAKVAGSLCRLAIDELPGASLFLADHDQPLNPKTRNWAYDALNLRGDNVWRDGSGTICLGESLARHQDIGASPPKSLLISGKRKELAVAHGKGYYDPESNTSLAYSVHDAVAETLIYRTIEQSVLAFARQVDALREELSADPGAASLRRARSLIARDLLDIHLISESLRPAIGKKWSFGLHGLSFRLTYEEELSRDHGTYLDNTQKTVRRRLKTVESNVAHFEKAAQTSAAFTASLASIRTARMSLTLSILSVTIALLALIVR